MWQQRATISDCSPLLPLWLLYDKIMFLSHQKVPKVANACSYSKEGVD